MSGYIVLCKEIVFYFCVFNSELPLRLKRNTFGSNAINILWRKTTQRFFRARIEVLIDYSLFIIFFILFLVLFWSNSNSDYFFSYIRFAYDLYFTQIYYSLFSKQTKYFWLLSFIKLWTENWDSVFALNFLIYSFPEFIWNETQEICL